MTLVSSLLYLLIGAARAADMVQYVPFPVVAGFLGMVGSSILRSAFVVNAGRPMSHPSDLLAFAISQPFELAACVALGLSLVLAKRLPVPNRVLLVAAIGTTLLGFYASKHAFGVDARWLREQVRATSPTLYLPCFSPHLPASRAGLALREEGGRALLVGLVQARAGQGALAAHLPGPRRHGGHVHHPHHLP